MERAGMKNRVPHAALGFRVTLDPQGFAAAGVPGERVLGGGFRTDAVRCWSMFQIASIFLFFFFFSPPFTFIQL